MVEKLLDALNEKVLFSNVTFLTEINFYVEQSKLKSSTIV